MKIDGLGIATALALALTTSLAACGAEETPENTDGDVLVKCEGINECKGQSECASADGSSSCEGLNACAGQGWITVTRDECAEQGGTELEEA